MLSKEEFFRRFTSIPPSSRDGIDKRNHFDIYFDVFSMNCLNEIHRYSVIPSFYDHYEYDPFETIQDTENFIKKCLKRMDGDKDSKTSMYWVVRSKLDDTLIGTACLVDLNFDRQSIEWGYGLDPALWGKGYILQIQEILKHYVFNILELNRIHGITMINNKKTIESVLASGFLNEGIAKDHYCKNGIFIDGWRYAITRKEFIASEFINSVDSSVSMQDIISIVQNVLDSEEVTSESSMDSIISWDSLNHMRVIIALKENLGINFTPSQIAEATSVSSIFKLITKQD